MASMKRLRKIASLALRMGISHGTAKYCISAGRNLASSDATMKSHGRREHPAAKNARALNLRHGRFIKIAPAQGGIEKQVAGECILATHPLGKWAAPHVLLFLRCADIVARREGISRRGHDDHAHITDGAGRSRFARAIAVARKISAKILRTACGDIDLREAESAARRNSPSS